MTTTKNQTLATVSSVTPSPNGTPQSAAVDPCFNVRFQYAPGADPMHSVLAKDPIPWRLGRSVSSENQQMEVLKTGTIAAYCPVEIPVPLSLVTTTPWIHLVLEWDKRAGVAQETYYWLFFFAADDSKNLGVRLIQLGYVTGYLDKYKITPIWSPFGRPIKRGSYVSNSIEQQALLQFQTDNGAYVVAGVTAETEKAIKEAPK
ncbi:MAG: hypothetical protein U0271_34280 [Polyangiaceae bacterium]